MKLRPPSLFACAFLMLAIVYTVSFGLSAWSNPAVAENRFSAFSKGGYPGMAEIYGLRAITLYEKAGANPDTLAPLKARVAAAAFRAHHYARSASLYETALNSSTDILFTAAVCQAEAERETSRA